MESLTAWLPDDVVAWSRRERARFRFLFRHSFRWLMLFSGLLILAAIPFFLPSQVTDMGISDSSPSVSSPVPTTPAVSTRRKKKARKRVAYHKTNRRDANLNTTPGRLNYTLHFSGRVMSNGRPVPHAIVQIFIDSGQDTFTTRAYPRADGSYKAALPIRSKVFGRVDWTVQVLDDITGKPLEISGRHIATREERDIHITAPVDFQIASAL
jgi:hypothetical protein